MSIYDQKLDENNFLLSLEKNGYLNLSNFFDKDVISRIKNEIEVIFSNRPESSQKPIKKLKNNLREYQDSPYYNSNNFLTTSLLGKSEYIDSFMKELFESDYFNNICKRIVGNNYRIYSCSARKIFPHSKSLSLHQDGFGMITLSIPLNDITEKSGTTLFLPKSHKYPFSILNKLFSISLFFFKFLCVKHIAKVGDFGFFFNKTFHAATNGEESTIIIISLVSEEGVEFQPWLLPKNTSYGKIFAEAVGEKLFYGLSSDKQIAFNSKKSFTTQLPANILLEQPRSVVLQKGFHARKVEVLESLYFSPIQKSIRMIDRVIFSNKYSLKSYTLYIFFGTFILMAKLKLFLGSLRKKL